MKTEDIRRTPRSHDPNEVSRALQELTPLSCTIVDRRGRPVPLSSAGFVLRFGKSYHLRVRSPFQDEDISEVRIVSPPAFLTVEPELPEIDDQGREVRAIPFKVCLDLWAQMRKLGIGIYVDEMEIVHYFHPSARREAPPYICPIVAPARLDRSLRGCDPRARVPSPRKTRDWIFHAGASRGGSSCIPAIRVALGFVALARGGGLLRVGRCHADQPVSTP